MEPKLTELQMNGLQAATETLLNRLTRVVEEVIQTGEISHRQVQNLKQALIIPLAVLGTTPQEYETMFAKAEAANNLATNVVQVLRGMGAA